MIKKILILFLMTLITGCASITREDCHELQWTEQGYQAGILGIRKNTKFADYASRCSEFGITPKRELFEKGYKKGHIKKCHSARTNAPYDKSCNQVNKNYASEYTLDKVRHLENKIQYLESENDQLQSTNRDLQLRLNTTDGCGHSH